MSARSASRAFARLTLSFGMASPLTGVSSLPFRASLTRACACSLAPGFACSLAPAFACGTTTLAGTGAFAFVAGLAGLTATFAFGAALGFATGFAFALTVGFARDAGFAAGRTFARETGFERAPGRLFAAAALRFFRSSLAREFAFGFLCWAIRVPGWNDDGGGRKKVAILTF